MSYGTVLVHLNRPDRCEAVLDAALQMAQPKPGRVIGLFLRQQFPPAFTVDSFGHTTLLTDVPDTERETENALAATFQRMTEGKPFVAEWRVIEAVYPQLTNAAVGLTYTSDLIVAGQNDPDWAQSAKLDLSEHLVLESGRPLLAIPYAGTFKRIDGTVVIAWKPGREAARAVFHAMPILKRAGKVHILQIEERRGATLRAPTELLATLASHGVKAEAHTSLAVEGGVGSELLSRLCDLDANLLVMGAYGHSRIREYVLGGATRDLMKQMTVPTLFSH